MVDEKVIDAFHMMWDNFPGPVRLIHKNRTVVAVNEAARNIGFQAGVPYFAVGAPEAHKGCKANEALSFKKGQVLKSGEEKIKYWLPVKDCDEVYVHFTIDTNAIK